MNKILSIFLCNLLIAFTYTQNLDAIKDRTIDKFLRIAQQVNRTDVSVGEIVIYNITVTNIHSNSTVEDVNVLNYLPEHFDYISESFKIDNISINAFIHSQTATFSLGNIPAGGKRDIEFWVRVGIDATGNQQNIAVAYGNISESFKVASFTSMTNIDVKKTKVFDDTAWVFGYIYVDINQNGRYEEEFEPSVAGTKIYMENGQYAISDKNGRYSFDRVRIGTHVLALDTETLPYSLKLSTKDERSQFVHIKIPTPWRQDFTLKFNKEMYDPLHSLLQINYTDEKNTIWQENMHYTFLFEKKTNYISNLDKWNLKQLFTNVYSAEKVTLNIIIHNEQIPKQKLFVLESFLKQRFSFKENLQIFWKNQRLIHSPFTKSTNKLASFQLHTTPHQVPANGKTEPAVLIYAVDENKDPVNTNAVITVFAENGNVLNQDLDDKIEGIQMLMSNGMAICILSPQNEVKTTSLSIYHEEIAAKTKIDYVPYNEDWVLIGIGEGTVGIDTSSKKESEGLYVNGRLAFFSRGKILGKYLLTALYDSSLDKEDTKSLFKSIDENKFYSVYHDPKLSNYEINSNSRLFVKLEKDENYIMYGDYNVNFSSSLVTYSHAFRGIAGQIRTEYLDVDFFGSKSQQTLIRDEIHGQGISGFYQLSHANIIPNSIQIVVETRNASFPEQIIDSFSKVIYNDYDVDFSRGKLLFDSPIPSADAFGNPIIIVATYTSESTGKDEYLWGTKANLKLFSEKMLLGGTYIHEGQNQKKNKIYNLALQINPLGGWSLNGEWGGTHVYDPQSNVWKKGLGYAFSTKIEFENAKGTIGYQKVSPDYYPSVVSGMGVGAEKLYLDAETSIQNTPVKLHIEKQKSNDSNLHKVSAEIQPQENIFFNIHGEKQKNNDHQMYNAGIETTFTGEDSQNLLGYQFVQKKSSEGRQKVHVASIGTKVKLSNLVAIHAERHQVFPSNKELIKNNAAPTANFTQVEKNIEHEFQYNTENINQRLQSKTILGAELSPSDWFTFWVNQEFSDSFSLDVSRTVLGVNLQIHEGTKFYSKYGIESWLGDLRNQALFGAQTAIPITTAFSGNFFFERLQTFDYENEEDFTSQGINFDLITHQHSGNFRTEMRYQKGDYSFLFNPSFTSRWNDNLMTYWNAQFTPREKFAIWEQTTLFGLSYRPNIWKNINFIGKTQVDWERNLANDSTYDALVWTSSLDLHVRLPKSMDVMFRYAYKYEELANESNRESIITDLVAARWLYELNEKFDVGFHFGSLNEYDTGRMNYGYGLECGYRVASDLWLSLGYNIKGIEDSSLRENNFLNDGFYISMRFKFDEESAQKFAAVW